MNVFCDDRIQLGWFSHSFQPPQMAGVFLGKITCQLKQKQVASPLRSDERISLSGDRYANDDTNGVPLYSTDFSPFKPKIDLLLNATAFVPQGRSQPNLDVRWKVGEWSKELKVFGEREWIAEPLSVGRSPAKPFQQMPLNYTNAFGAPNSKFNPLGKGFGSSEKQIPNIESPNRSIKVPFESIEPAGFGCIPGHWPQRKENLGTYDSAWLKSRWPWMPNDFNYAFFNSAPSDQQLERNLVGNEELAFENLHPQHALFQSFLPGLRVRCFVGETESVDESMDSQFREIAMRLDTLLVDMHAEQFNLVWRGATPTKSLKMREIKAVIMIAESITVPPLSKAEYLAAYRLHRLRQMSYDPPPPTEAEIAAEAQRAQDEENNEREFQQLRKQAEEMKKQAYSQALAAGVTASQLEGSPNISFEDIKKAMKAAADNLRSEQPDFASKIDAEAKKLDDLEAEFASANLKRLTREDVERMAAAKESFVDCDLSELKLNDLNLSGLDFSGADFSKCFLSNANFSTTNCTGANFSGTDLTSANFEGASLDVATFTDSVLGGAIFRKASIEDSNFSKLDLKGLDFSGSKGYGVDFSGGDLTGANFTAAVLPQSDFCDSILVKTIFINAELRAAQFERVKAERVQMQGADLSGLHGSDGSDFTQADFRKTNAVGSIWEDSILDQADFTGSTLVRSLFTFATLRNAKLDLADLSLTVFDDADLTGASLQKANLLRSSMDRTNLSNAVLRDSNLYNAGFWDAIMIDTDLRNANTRGTVLP